MLPLLVLAISIIGVVVLYDFLLLFFLVLTKLAYYRKIYTPEMFSTSIIFIVPVISTIFWPRRIASMRPDPFLHAHRHTLFICTFTYHILCFFVLLNVPILSIFYSTCYNVLNRVGWLDDLHGLYQSYVTQRQQSLFTLISHFSIVLTSFQFPLKIGYFFAWWFFAFYELSSWDIINN